MRKLAALLALSGAERRLLAVSLIATPVMSSGLAILGYRRLHALLSRCPRPRGTRFPAGPAGLARARGVARMVAIAAGSGPVRATCLRRSLLVWWLLRRDGIDAVIRVGVGRGGVGALEAHAWVEYLGQPLNETEDVADRFLPFERDFGAPPERFS